MKATSDGVSHQSHHSSGRRRSNVPSHQAPQKNAQTPQFSRKDHKETHVHFSNSTTDILSVLRQRATSCQNLYRYSNPFERSAESRRPCRPALKYSIEMSKYLREAGTQFAKALALFGKWCTGVTSTNPNVRSDMYKQLVAQTRSTSPHLKYAVEGILLQSINGMWIQLVDDFSIQRVKYTDDNIVLHESAAQLLAVILSNHRLLEKLEMEDVQTLILEILTRLEYHVSGKRRLGDRLQSHIWLLGTEVSCWWEANSIIYSEEICKRLYEAMTEFNIQDAPPLVQTSLLEIFRIVFSKHPDAEFITINKILLVAWDFMWAEDEQLKNKARQVVSLIADYHGGCADVTRVIKHKIPSGSIFKSRFMPIFMEEMKKKAEEALDLWLIITRLLKGTLITIAQNNLDTWTSIPLHHLYTEHGYRAVILLSFQIHYFEPHILAHDKVYQHYAKPFQNKSKALLILDSLLNTNISNNPALEPLPKGAPRRPLALKVWAKITADAFTPFTHVQILTSDAFTKHETDILVARIICHWDWMIRGFMDDTNLTEFQDEDTKTEYLKEVLAILAKEFAKRIKNAWGEVGNYTQQAIHVFWFNLMVTTLSRDKEKDKVFPVEILRSLHPYIIAGLESTQTRVRQSTYRFLMASDILSEMRWLKDKEGIALLSAMETAREEFEAEPRSNYNLRVPQIDDFASLVLNHGVEKAMIHPMTMTPVVSVTLVGDVKWIWYLPDGKQCELGQEFEFEREEDQEKVAEMNAAKEQRERERLAKKAKEKEERKKMRGKKSTKQKKADAAPAAQESSQTAASRKEDSTVSAPDSRKRKLAGDEAQAAGPQSKRKLPEAVEKLIKLVRDGESPAPALATETSSTTNEANQVDDAMEIEEETPSESPDWAKIYDPAKPSIFQEQAAQEAKASSGNQDTLSSKPFFQEPTYDKRMPPPPVNWKNKGRKAFALPPSLPASQSKEPEPAQPAEEPKPVEPASLKSYVTTGTQTSSGQKRGHEEAEFEPMPGPNAKRRMLKSDYIPAYHTSWKPDWIENTQCYPVNELGFELSEEKCLRGDVVHRNADRLKRVLEQDAMYITTDKVEHLMEIVKETMTSLEKAKEYTDRHPSKVSVTRWKFA